MPTHVCSYVTAESTIYLYQYAHRIVVSWRVLILTREPFQSDDNLEGVWRFDQITSNTPHSIVIFQNPPRVDQSNLILRSHGHSVSLKIGQKTSLNGSKSVVVVHVMIINLVLDPSDHEAERGRHRLAF